MDTLLLYHGPSSGKWEPTLLVCLHGEVGDNYYKLKYVHLATSPKEPSGMGARCKHRLPWLLIVLDTVLIGEYTVTFYIVGCSD